MNIAIIRRRYDPNGGGAEKYASYVVDELIARGHSITVFAEKYANVPEAVKVVAVPRPLLPTLCRTASFARSAQKVVDPTAFDVVFAMSRYVGADVYRQAEQLHAVWLPIFYSALSRFNPRHAGILKLELKVFDSNRTGHVVTNSELVRSQIMDLFAFPGENISVIRNGVDKDRFKPVDSGVKTKLRGTLGIGSDKIVLLFIAGNFKIKGLDKAIEAIAALDELIRIDVHLVVVGGDDSHPFIKLAQQLGIASQITFAGRQNAMQDYYAASDMLIYPSLYEPFGNVCLESCACGVPVLTTAQNGSSELIEHGSNGYIIETADCVADMSRCLNEFIALDYNAKRGMAAQALAASEGYAWNRHVDGLEQLFKEITQKKI